MIGYSLSTIGADIGPVKRLALPRPDAVEVALCTNCTLPECDQSDPRCPFCDADPVSPIMLRAEATIWVYVKSLRKQVYKAEWSIMRRANRV